LGKEEKKNMLSPLRQPSLRRLGLVAVVAAAFPASWCGAGSGGACSLHQKFEAIDAASFDRAGQAVGISGDYAAVGADLANPGSVHLGGVVYVLFRNGAGPSLWGEVAQLSPSDAQSGDTFGVSVAIDGDLLVAGADGEDAVAPAAGAAYIFRRDQGGPGAWGEVIKLTPSQGQTLDSFGRRVAISGNTVVIGAPGVVGYTGEVYVFERNLGGPDNWGEAALLTASDAATGDYFGTAIAIDGDTILVGAHENDDTGFASGAAYILQRDGQNPQAWNEVVKLLAPDAAAYDYFGNAVALHGDVAVVCAWQDDDLGSNSGAAYVFGRNQGGPEAWGFVTKLTAADGVEGDMFGSSAAATANAIVIGAMLHGDVPGSNGAAYVFTTCDGDWTQTGKLVASQPAFFDTFGTSVDASGDTVIVGSPYDDGSAPDAGAAFIFDSKACGFLECPPCTGDTDQSGVVDVTDLIAVILAWGPCP
jgi:hypothetical protein